MSACLIEILPIFLKLLKFSSAIECCHNELFLMVYSTVFFFIEFSPIVIVSISTFCL